MVSEGGIAADMNGRGSTTVSQRLTAQQAAKPQEEPKQ